MHARYVQRLMRFLSDYRETYPRNCSVCGEWKSGILIFGKWGDVNTAFIACPQFTYSQSYVDAMDSRFIHVSDTPTFDHGRLQMYNWTPVF